MKEIILIFLFILLHTYPANSQSQWFWQDPLPQGNTLNDIFLISSSKAVAVGTLGTIMVTENGGQDWNINYHTAGPYKYLTSVFFIDQNTGWAVGYQGSILKTINGGNNWNLMNAPNLYYYSVWFINQDTGWAAATFGAMAYTNDGGQNWVSRNPGISAYYKSVEFYNNDTGWAAGGNALDGSKIIRTTNAGQNWINAATIPGKSITSMKFISKDTGWVAGFDGLIMKTINHGINWQTHFGVSLNYNLVSIDFKDNMTGWASGWYYNDSAYGAVIIKSTDGGTGWQTVYKDSGFSVNSLKYSNGVLIGAGDGGKIIKSTDEGATWFYLFKGIEKNLSSIQFLNYITGWVAGSGGTIVKSTDGGNSWNNYFSTGLKHEISGIKFVNNDTGWVISNNNNEDTSFIMRTTNGGFNWSKQDSSNRKFNSIFFTSVVTGWVCGDNVKLLKTTNSGTNWILTSNGVSGNLSQMSFINDLTGWVVGSSSGIYKTTNGGDQWVSQPNPATAGLQSVYFVDQNTGWASGGFQTIRTVDGGDYWYQQFGTDNHGTKAFYFIDGNTGWAVGSRYHGITIGDIMRTNNGGHNWTIDEINTNSKLTSVSFVNSNANLIEGWACGENGTIIKISNVPVSINESTNSIPDNIYLHQNFPNPFNPSTKIKFYIKNTSEPGSRVNLTVYDALGKVVKVLLNNELSGGNHEVEFNSKDIASGIYFYKLNYNGISLIKRMVVVK